MKKSGSRACVTRPQQREWAKDRATNWNYRRGSNYDVRSAPTECPLDRLIVPKPSVRSARHVRPIRRCRCGLPAALYVVGVCLNRIGTQQAFDDIPFRSATRNPSAVLRPILSCMAKADRKWRRQLQRETNSSRPAWTWARRKPRWAGEREAIKPIRIASRPRERGRVELARAQAASAARSGLSAKTTRLRDKDHREFVAAQPCVVCGRTPADPHHLRFAQPRALGARSATNSPVRCAGCVTTRCGSAATRRRGGRASISTRRPSRWRFGAACADAAPGSPCEPGGPEADTPRANLADPS